MFFYFIYQYIKVKNEQLELNKTLLGYITIFGLALTGYMIRIINLYFIKDINIDLFRFLTKITFIFLFSSLMSFLLNISSKTFKNIININLSRSLGFSILVPIIFIYFFEPESIIFMLTTLIILVISFTYIFFFHFKLIRFSTGNVKKRLYLIIFGFILCAIQVFIGGYIPSYILLKNYSSFLQLIAAPIFIIGLLIVFLGIYRFPAFLEFEWKENLLELYIVDKRNFKLIYEFYFQSKIDKNHIKQIKSLKNQKTELFISRGIFGIDEIISLITKTEKENIEKIHQEDFIIILEYANEPISFIILCLLIKKEMNSSSYFLKMVKNNFELLYKNIILNIDSLEGTESKLFQSFDKTIKELIK